MLDRRPRPLQLRGAERRVAPDAADDQAGRPVADGRLEDRAGLRGRRPEAHQGRIRRAADRRARLAARTVEELHLLAKLVRGLGSENIDHRTAPRRFRPCRAAPGSARWLGTSIASLSHLERALSSARSCARTIRCSRSACARRRVAARSCTACTRCTTTGLMPVAHADHGRASRLGPGAGRQWPRRWPRRRASPRRWPARSPAPGQRIAASLLRGERKAILLGNAAAQHPQAGRCWRWRSGSASNRRHGRLSGRGRQQRRRAAGRRAAGRGRPERRPDAERSR